MRHQQLYKFTDTDGAGMPEVEMSRYDENSDFSKPAATVLIYPDDTIGEYTSVAWGEDVDGDGTITPDDESYYTTAANLLNKLTVLRAVDHRKLYDKIVIGFNDTSGSDVKILHFKCGNTDLNSPDLTVIASTPNSQGHYLKIFGAGDADADGDIDKNDELIYRNLATSFASMQSLRASRLS